MMAVDDDSSCDMPTARLVEAPEVRERVIQEILFLVDHLRLRDDSEKYVCMCVLTNHVTLPETHTVYIYVMCCM